MQILKEEVLGQPLGLLEPNDLGSAGIDRLLEETVKEGVQMLPVDRNALSERLNNEDPQVIMMIGEEVVGYCAMTGVYKEKDGYIHEIGSLIVNPNYRGKGIAHKLVSVMTDYLLRLGIKKIIAFCNPDSEPIFTGSGYKIQNPSNLPVAIFEPCAQCPKKPKSGGCCDTILGINNI
jgi:N-acetylglutamate synthase-like GNAT family acetyltransferase